MRTPSSPSSSAPSAEAREFDVLFDAIPDISWRDQRDSLERPLVSLSKNKRIEKQEYWFGELFLRIIPHQEFGQPTIWDYDIIIYLLAQVNERFKQQRDYVSQQDLPSLKMVKTKNGYQQKRAWSWETPAISVNPRALLRAIGRGTGGKDFRELRAAIARLQTCVIETNIWHGKKISRFKRFTLIHEFDEDAPTATESGGMRFVLPDWMIRSVETRKGILSIHPLYFNLTGGYEKFLYRMARKIAGRQQTSRTLKMATLHERSGSPMTRSDFAKSIRRVVSKSQLPEYALALERNESGEEIILFTWRGETAVLGEDDGEHSSPEEQE